MRFMVWSQPWINFWQVNSSVNPFAVAAKLKFCNLNFAKVVVKIFSPLARLFDLAIRASIRGLPEEMEFRTRKKERILGNIRCVCGKVP